MESQPQKYLYSNVWNNLVKNRRTFLQFPNFPDLAHILQMLFDIDLSLNTIVNDLLGFTSQVYILSP